MEDTWFRIQCLFCGGKNCKYENCEHDESQAIYGLRSTWVTPNIIASQRPSTRLIKQYSIISQFEK